MCLVGAASNYTIDNYEFQRYWGRRSGGNYAEGNVASRYDQLAIRFGERLNIAIRNRILANRARRALLASPAKSAVAEEAITV